METADGHFKLAFCSITYEVTIPAVHLQESINNHLKFRPQRLLKLDTEIQSSFKIVLSNSVYDSNSAKSAVTE